jgi:hypothetical protein
VKTSEDKLAQAGSLADESLMRLRFVALTVLILNMSLCVWAQSAAVPQCKPVDLNAHFAFVHEPDSFFSVIINFRNTSEVACELGDLRGLMFQNEHKLTLYGWDHFCENCAPPPDGGRTIFSAKGYPLDLRPILEPKQIVHIIYRWRTQAASSSQECQPVSHAYVRWAGRTTGYGVSAPDLLPPVCSTVQIGNFIMGRYKLAAESDSDGSPDLRFTSEKTTYFSGEYLSVHLDAPELTDCIRAEQGCPHLYTYEREPDGETSLRELEPRILSSNSADNTHVVGFEQRRLTGNCCKVGINTLEVMTTSGEAEGQVKFEASEPLTIRIADPNKMKREWGTSFKGLAASLTLDKSVYKVGEDIPLHLAVENFSSDDPIYGSPYPLSFCMRNYRIELTDAQGRRRQPREDAVMEVPEPPCAFSGMPNNVVFEKSKVFFGEPQLRYFDLLPGSPGTYSLRFVWEPRNCDSRKCSAPDGMAADRKRYAEVFSNTVTFKVVGKANPTILGVPGAFTRGTEVRK